MMISKRKISIAVLLLSALASSLWAQNGLNIPFSQYGLGYNSTPFNMPFAASMGGVTITRSASNMVNPFNPASYGAIQPCTFVFDMGLSIETSTMKDPNNSLYDADGKIGYLTFAMPLSKWWKTSFGLLPYSDVNYQSIHTQTDETGKIQTVYEGVGGVSRLYWGHAFNLGKKLSVGFNANYLYGNIHRAITYEFSGYDSTYYMNARREKSSMMKNFTFDLGVQYTQPIADKYTLTLGATAATPRKMNVNDNAMIYTFVQNAGMTYMRDTIFPTNGESGDYVSTLEQPLNLGLGISFARDRHWLLALDAIYAPWSGMKYTENTNYQIFGKTAILYDDNIKLALGGQFLGDPDASKYGRRITYSAGIHYEKGKLQLQMADATSWCLNDWGFGVGCSLPMRKGLSVLNLSVSFDSFGTIDLVRRNTVLFGISVGSCESWFVKRKYN